MAFYSKVVGVAFENPDGSSRQQYIKDYCFSSQPLILKREPNNRYDKNAVGVWIKRKVFLFFESEIQIGYLSAELAEDIAECMDSGGTVEACISEITGGTAEHPTIGVKISIST